MFKDDRVRDVMETQRAGAAQSTSDPFYILSNLTQICNEKSQTQETTKIEVKQVNSVFSKPA